MKPILEQIKSEALRQGYEQLTIEYTRTTHQYAASKLPRTHTYDLMREPPGPAADNPDADGPLSDLPHCRRQTRRSARTLHRVRGCPAGRTGCLPRRNALRGRGHHLKSGGFSSPAHGHPGLYRPYPGPAAGATIGTARGSKTPLVAPLQKRLTAATAPYQKRPGRPVFPK